MDFGGAMREDLGAFHWERFVGRFRLYIPQIGPPAPPALNAPDEVQQALPSPARAGFDTQLRKEGVGVELRRMDAPAPVRVAHRGKTYAYIVEALAALLTFAGAIWLLPRGRGAKWGYFLFVGLGALVVSGAVNPRATGPWQMAAFGVFAGVGVWLIAGIGGVLRVMMERRREREVQAAARAAAEALARHPIPPVVTPNAGPEAKPEEPPTLPGAPQP